ncbi:DNA topoisomerase 1 [Bacteroidia bacterium]|nr:DNA topoisomerase 1 [Bacteroidia bacterium]
MKDNLVIVESPAKAKTIEKFLGENYTVRSSYGHVRDLVTKGLGVDIQNGFAPQYEVADDKGKVVGELAKLASGAKAIWLASDEDREGEAIAWHLSQVLKLPTDKTRRIVFHEITKNAILAAIDNPRGIDMDLVDAQQARRILDRLVGFELSPVLWKKVKPHLSAGRVQSVAVRLIVEREREIIGFASKRYFRVVGQFFLPDAPKNIFRAELGKRFDTREQTLEFLNACVEASHTVLSSERKPATKSPAPPFTTSTLQQEAGRKLGMSVARTMAVAQRLYESGYITYMRTDSVNLSAEAIGSIKREVVSRFGENYSQVRNFKTSTKGAQEAHEAIRPSYADRHTIEGSSDEKRLYELIWKRAVASQMASAQIEKTVVVIDVSSRPERFTATGEVIRFDGFLRLYSESSDDAAAEGDDNTLLPDMKVGQGITRDEVTATESFTQAPPRYSEASLVKRLEELGIGRPSTYAPTITTIINRGYVEKGSREGEKRAYLRITLAAQDKLSEKSLTQNAGAEKNKLFPTDIGMLVTDYLTEQFSAIMDYNFTANVEQEFDNIAEGKEQWVAMIETFYRNFHPTVESAMDSTPQNRNNLRVLGVDPTTGRQVSARIGRFGPMVQIEAAEEGEKPRYASLRKGQLIESITLSEALELFDMPRNLGQHEQKDVVIGLGRYGPYVLYDKKFTSLDKTDDPYTVTIERAVEIIRSRETGGAAGGKTPLKSFESEPRIDILKGIYGPYMACEGKNYRIPKGTDPMEITEAQAREMIANAPAPKPRPRGRGAKK